MPAHDPFAPSSGVKLSPTGDPLDASEEPKNASVPELEPEPTAETKDELEVPRGTAKEVAAWVGDDVERAKAALEVEQASAEPRKGLSADLEAIINE